MSFSKRKNRPQKLQTPALQWEGCLLSQFLEFLELRGRLLDTSAEAGGCGGSFTEGLRLGKKIAPGFKIYALSLYVYAYR